MIPDLEIYEQIEELGGMVVSDDLCLGSRYFWDEATRTYNPLFGLARHRLECIPCSCMCSEKVAEDRLAHIINLTKRYRVDGVIFATYKWCDPIQMDRPDMMRELENENIPVLSVEMEKIFGAAQQRTRLEAFFESRRLMPWLKR
nr:2-hydroxyacyl-CoA dehydratase [Desulfobacterales bacterium]